MRHFVMLAFVLSVPLGAVADAPENGYSVVGLATYALQYPSEFKNNNIRGVSLSLIEEDRDRVYGLNLGLGYSYISETMAGVQISLFADGFTDVNGIQIGIIGNQIENFNGIVVAGLINFAHGSDSSSCGLQMAGLASVHFEGMRGMQISLVGNVTGHIKGFQASTGYNLAEGYCHGLQIGLGNRAGVLHGLQIGAVNVALTGSGVQIGLFNSFGEDDNRRILPLLNFRF